MDRYHSPPSVWPFRPRRCLLGDSDCLSDRCRNNRLRHASPTPSDTSSDSICDQVPDYEGQDYPFRSETLEKYPRLSRLDCFEAEQARNSPSYPDIDAELEPDLEPTLDVLNARVEAMVKEGETQLRAPKYGLSSFRSSFPPSPMTILLQSGVDGCTAAQSLLMYQITRLIELRLGEPLSRPASSSASSGGSDGGEEEKPREKRAWSLKSLFEKGAVEKR